MTSLFKIMYDEINAYDEAVVCMNKLQELMLNSDFGRAEPQHVHELARRAAGIPDHVRIGETPLADWQEDQCLDLPYNALGS